MQVLGRRGRKKWGNVLPGDHLTFNEVKMIFDNHGLGVGSESTREEVHLTRCRHCIKIRDGLNRSMILQLEAAARAEPCYVGCGV